MQGHVAGFTEYGLEVWGLQLGVGTNAAHHSIEAEWLLRFQDRCCQANMAHTGQSMPGTGLGCRVKVLQNFELFPLCSEEARGVNSPLEEEREINQTIIRHTGFTYSTYSTYVEGQFWFCVPHHLKYSVLGCRAPQQGSATLDPGLGFARATLNAEPGGFRVSERRTPEWLSGAFLASISPEKKIECKPFWQ